MHVGIPTEIKNNEYRVAITPAGVAELIKHGHEVLIQAGAGEGSAIADNDFKAAGAQIVTTADQVWAESDLLLKVKEPIAAEYHRMRKGQTLFTYLHLAASRPCTDALMSSGTTSIAYETVQTADGFLPLLAPMSEVAGRLSAQVGAYHLMRTQGARGVLMGGVPGVAPAEVVVIGAGTKTGFTPQTTLLVKRDGKLIGKVRPTAIEPTQTIADIVTDSMAPGVRLQPGDRVILAKTETR